MKRCYSRFDDGAYLQTCLKAKGHTDIHEGDNNSQWTDEQGWWDAYGDSPERAVVAPPVDDAPPLLPAGAFEELP